MLICQKSHRGAQDPRQAQFSSPILNARLPHEPMQKLGQIVPQQTNYPNHHKDLEELKPMLGSHLGLKEAFMARRDSFRRTRGKATRGEILFHEGILLVPTIAEPLVKLVRVIERNVRNREATPVKVDRFRRLATEICAKEREEILAKLTSPVLGLVAFVIRKRGQLFDLRDPLVGNCAVIYVVNRPLELGETEIHACAPR